MSQEARQDLLRNAANRMGIEQLCKALNAPQSLIEAWMSGHASMPDRKFIALADLLDSMDE